MSLCSELLCWVLLCSVVLSFIMLSVWWLVLLWWVVVQSGKMISFITLSVVRVSVIVLSVVAPFFEPYGTKIKTPFANKFCLFKWRIQFLSQFNKEGMVLKIASGIGSDLPLFAALLRLHIWHTFIPSVLSGFLCNRFCKHPALIKLYLS